MKRERFSQGGTVIITNNNGKLHCLVCVQVLSVRKEFNLKRHYIFLHENKLKKYQGRARIALLEDYKKKTNVSNKQAYLLEWQRPTYQV
jgi:hypothetical protein